jgi:hypothetical protein
MTSPALTQLGVILGTAAYMSPEQARGRPVDRRADIWAFGVVLWEMLTGRRLFEADTMSDTIAAVLRAEVDHGVLPSSTPIAVRWLLERCLDRDSTTRLRDIGEAARILRAPGEALPVVSRASSTGRTLGAIAIVVAAVLGMAVGAFVAPRWFAAPADSGTVAQLDLRVRDLATRGVRALQMSADGSTLVLRIEQPSRLVVRRLAQSDIVPIPGTEGTQDFIVSDDGREVVFVRKSQLMRLPTSGGTATLVTPLLALRGAAWGPDGWLYVAGITAGGGDGAASYGIFRVPLTGGTMEPMVEPEPIAAAREWYHSLAWLGNGQLLYAVGTQGPEGTRAPAIEVLDVASRTRRVVAEFQYVAYVMGDGLAVSDSNGRVSWLPFDPATARVTGPPVDLGVTCEISNGIVPQLAAGLDGTLACLPAHEFTESVELVDASTGTLGAQVLGVPQIRGRVFGTLSANGRWWATWMFGDEVIVHDLEMNGARRVIRGERRPVWTHAGTLLLQRTDTVIEWSDDLSRPEREVGRNIDAVLASGRDGLTVWRTAEGGIVQGQLTSAGLEAEATWPATLSPTHVDISPDGRWILADMPRPEGGQQLFILPASRPDAALRVADHQGLAHWDHDSRGVYYRSATSAGVVHLGLRITGTSVTAGATRQVLTGAQMIDVHSDGRLLVIATPENPDADLIRVVLNVPALVRQRQAEGR